MNIADGYARREFLKNSLASIPVLMASNAVFGKSGDLTSLTLQQASELVRTKSVSPVDLLRACLQRIERLNPVLNAFITVTDEAALVQARELERERQRGRWRGSLHGIPIALKDNIDTAGIRTTAASAVFANRVPTEDAEVVRRLKAAGAVIIGKLNLHEFAHGLTSAISHFGPVHNPWQLEYMAGGSSGGCGAAVAAGLCYGAIGTDTGASVRYPAACCGIVGLKPTYGLVSARGVIPDSWSFDHVGPMCRTVTDTAMLLSGIAGYDPEDSGSIDAPRRDYARLLPASTASWRLGRLMFEERLDAEVEAAVNQAIKALRQLTAGVREVKLPSLPDLFASVADAEDYAYHAPHLEKTPELYNPVTRNDLQAGAKVKIAEYMQGRRELDRQRHLSGRLFADVDLLVTPTYERLPLPLTACHEAFPDLGWHTGEMNIFGVPALSLPCGLSKAGLPIGLQIIGPRLGEASVLALALAYEQVTNWHKHKPAVS